MAWKDWSYWVKGAILTPLFILSLIFILVGINGLIITGSPLGASVSNGLMVIIFVLILPGIFIASGITGYNDGHNLEPIAILSWVITIIIYPILGALIGWIYGKIKNRNSK